MAVNGKSRTNSQTNGNSGAKPRSKVEADGGAQAVADSDETQATEATTPSVPVAPEFGDISPVLATTGDQMKSVLSATQKATENIEAEAKAEAAQYVAKVRERTDTVSSGRLDQIASVTSDLMSQAGEVEKQVQQLRKAITQATEQLSRDLDLNIGSSGQSPSPVASSGASNGSADAASATDSDQGEWMLGSKNGETTEEESAGGSKPIFGKRRGRKSIATEGSEGARLLAVQLSMAGTDDEAIERRLREDFGIADPTPLMKSVRTAA